jgi:outer membrane protein OmpA-like peptidoglycan-associated protein
MPVLHSNSKIVYIWLFSIILLIGLLSGCASTEKFLPLERAREAYSKAEANPDVKTNAPVALYEAHEALKKAERAIDLEEKQHLSYLSEKKSEMAVAVAEQKQAEKEMALLKEEEERVILESRLIETKQARSDAATSARETLAAREDAMRFKSKAEIKSREAQEALDQAAKLESELANLESELANLKAVKTDRGMVLTLGDVLFATGKAELAPGATQTMNSLAAFLNKYTDRKIIIEGHTDSTGSASFNQGLSERRAQSVKIALLERGIGFDRIDTAGYGMDRPVAGNDTAAGRQQNRRVEIVISNPSEPAAQTE